MPYKPIIIKLPKFGRSKRSDLSHNLQSSKKWIDVIVLAAACVTVVSAVTFTAYSVLAAFPEIGVRYGLSNRSEESFEAENEPSSRGDISSGVTGKNAPTVQLISSTSDAAVGDIIELKWQASRVPSSCQASDDWSGTKGSSGSKKITLDTAKIYLFTLTCKTTTGTGFAAVSINVKSVTGSGDTLKRPHVVLSSSSSKLFVGDKLTLTWDVSNSPTSCTASGGWSGAKAAKGSQITNAPTSTGTKIYGLECVNGSGSEKVEISIDVSAKPTTTVGAPKVSISISPTTITAGSAATVSWSATNSPTSCKASGSWSGSKASNGSQSTGTMGTAGTFSFSLSCSNAGGSGSASASLKVNAAPVVVYCGGKTPCYGRSDLAAHGSVNNCWGWNKDWVINITSYQPNHSASKSSSATSDLASASTTCNHDIAAVLAGSAAIPGYKTSGGSTKHSHKSSTKDNASTSRLNSYRVGYYDANKP